MSPRTRLITHLVVHRGMLLHRDVVAPVEMVERVLSSPDELVFFRCTSDELNQMPAYRSQLYTSPPGTWSIPPGYSAGQVLLALTGTRTGSGRLTAARSGASPGPTAAGLTIGAGTPVTCRDGPVGVVDVVLIDPLTQQATHFVVRRGLILGKDVIVPVDWTSDVSAERVLLDVGEEQLAKLPEYRLDEAVAVDLGQALSTDESIGRLDFYFLHFEVQGGRVWLSGNVGTVDNKILAERISWGVRGVLDVRNDLVNDEELLMRVGQLLSEDSLAGSGEIEVAAVQGLIRLVPLQASDEQMAAAERIARTVPGVRAVMRE